MKSHTPDRRKQLGAFYTDDLVADFLVNWGAGISRESLLDPSCGDGRFLSAAGKNGIKRIVGCDVDPNAIAASKRRMDSEAVEARMVQSDFFAVSPRKILPVDLVAGNPPFVRYQRFKGETRRLALETALKHGVRLSKLTSSWAPFLLHALHFLRPGGTMAMVVPAEIVQTAYGVPTLRALTRAFARVRLLTFERNIFDDAQEETFLLLGEGYGGRSEGVEPVPLRDRAALMAYDPNRPFESSARVAVPSSGQLEFLRAYLSPAEQDFWEQISSNSRVEPLRTFAAISNGYVTGANDFFHTTVADGEKRGLPKHWLRPAARSAKSLLGLAFTAGDRKQLEINGVAHTLIVPEEAESDVERKALDKLVAAGQKTGIHERFKCRIRSPWWKVPNQSVPDLLVPYMIGTAPRAAINEIRAVYTNSLHGLKVKEGIDPYLISISLLSSVARLSMELIGRSYGGGILKIEPTELCRILLPYPDFPAEEVRRIHQGADELLRQGDYAAAVAMVDDAILVGHLGYASSDVETLRSAVHRLENRRTQRRKK